MNYNFVIFDCLVSLGIGAFIWFYLFAGLRRDNFRSEIRRIRDDLFDFMWENGYDFDTPAYCETRQMLNGILRLSNKLSPVSFFVSIIFAATQETCSTEPQSIRTSGSPDKVTDVKLEKKLQEVRWNAIKQLLIFVYYQGIFVVFMRIVAFFLKLARTAIRAKEWVIRGAERFVRTVAYPMGSPNLPGKSYSRLVRS